MASLQKNVASQHFTFATVSSTSGALTTSTSTTQFNALAWWAKDGSQAAAGGTFTSLGNGQWDYSPTQAETNATNVSLLVAPSVTIPVNVTIWTDQVDANGFFKVDLEDIKGTAVSTTVGQLAVNTVALSNTALTARDIGASVLVSSGTGTGQLSINSGVIDSNLTKINGAAASSSSTALGVNVTSFGGTIVTGRDIGASVLLSAGSGSGQLDFTSGVVKANLTQINGAAATSTSTALGVNVTSFGGTVVTGRDIGASVLVSSGTGTGQIALTSGQVTVATNNDKTGYTASTVSDKTGYSLSSAGNNSAADALLDRDMSIGADSGSTTVRTPRQALRFSRNKFDITAGTLTVFKEDDVTASWTGVVTASSAVFPITDIDPAGP